VDEKKRKGELYVRRGRGERVFEESSSEKGGSRMFERGVGGGRGRQLNTHVYEFRYYHAPHSVDNSAPR
jgi:hypothetical protein